MQIANVKYSDCEAKFGFRVWETKFGRVHRKTAPTYPLKAGLETPPAEDGDYRSPM